MMCPASPVLYFAAIAVFVGGCSAKTEEESGWSIADGADQQIDTRTMTVARWSEESLSPTDRSARARLGVSCSPEAFLAAVHVPRAYGPAIAAGTWSYPLGEHRVTYQFDDQKQRNGAWTTSIDGDIATLMPLETRRGSAQFVRSLRRAKVLTVTYTPENRNAKTVHFRLDSISDLLDRAERTCGLTLNRGPRP